MLAGGLLATAAIVAFWGDPRGALLAWNTFRLAAAVVAICLPIGTLLAFLLSRTDMPGRAPLSFVLGTMLFMPLYLQAAAWKAGFGLDGAFPAFSLGPAWLDLWPGAITVHAAAAVPWVVLIVGLGLRLVEPDLEEEALLDGSAWQVVRRVTAPAALAPLGVAVLWVTVGVSGEMTVTDLFRVRTFAEELYTHFATEPGSLPVAVLPGVALTGFLVLAALLLIHALSRAERPAALRRPFVFRLGIWRWPAAALSIVLILVLAGLPLASLLYKAGIVVSKDAAGQLARSWSPAKLVTIVAQSPLEYSRELSWTLALGGLAATTALCVALPLAWIARRGGVSAWPALLLTALALAVPGPLIGLGMIAVLNQPDSPLLNALYDSLLFCPWLALSIRALPLTMLIAWYALRSLPGDPLEQAATEGAGAGTRLLRIALPQRRAALAAAWLTAFVVSVGDLSASVLVLPPGVEPIGHRIFSLVHSGVEDEVAGISLAMVLFVAALGWLLWWIARRWGATG
jgi:iron(III) transport system permease protein